MKKKYFYLITILTFICILAFGVVMILLIGENSRCTANPLSYGVSKIEEAKPNYVLCSCQVDEFTIYFDSKGIYKENPLFNKSQTLQFNITERGLT